MPDRIRDRLGHHHHARAAAKGVVIGILVLAQREGANVRDPEIKNAPVSCSRDDA